MTAGAARSIAVDGPAASGKGTIAAAVARALGFHYLDSGVALPPGGAEGHARRASTSTTSPRWPRLAAALDVRFATGRSALDGEDVAGGHPRGSRLRRGVAGGRPSRGPRGADRAPAGVPPAARAWWPTGATWGPSCFPDAPLKVFLTATAEERARRRHKQLIAKGISVTMDSLLRDIRERDARDAGRAAAPLVPAADAVLLDTTHLTIDEAIARVLALYPHACSSSSGDPIQFRRRRATFAKRTAQSPLLPVAFTRDRPTSPPAREKGFSPPAVFD